MDTLIDGSLNGVSSRAAAASDTAAAPSGGCPRGLTYLSISLSPGVDIAAAGTRDPAWARIWQSPTVRRRVDLPAWDARGGRGCGWGTRCSLGPSVPVREASPRRRCAGTRVTSPFAHPPAMLAPATTWRGARGETRTSSGTKRGTRGCCAALRVSAPAGVTFGRHHPALPVSAARARRAKAARRSARATASTARARTAARRRNRSRAARRAAALSCQQSASTASRRLGQGGGDSGELGLGGRGGDGRGPRGGCERRHGRWVVGRGRRWGRLTVRRRLLLSHR